MRMTAVLTSFVALIGVATPAHADPAGDSASDASFLAALNKAGITYESPATAVGVGKRACELMDEGHPQVDVIHNVSSSNPGFTVDGAAQFTMIAASAYCPQHLGQPVGQATSPTGS
ncbi:DUF732 domain-containing protein [Mycobacterium sp. WUMAC-067]|nr:DUF732 domain-containing protein [Mycobacterium sp. WUMAC-067]MCA2313147.1 DUF732 domain-containing protein [Mycobacterium sp. WUMAC-025]